LPRGCQVECRTTILAAKVQEADTARNWVCRQQAGRSLYPAADLLAVYLARWQIENVFQAITEVFELRHLIGCAPQATVFQASLCLVMYNVLQVLRGYAAAVAPEPVAVEALSAEQIFTDLH